MTTHPESFAYDTGRVKIRTVATADHPHAPRARRPTTFPASGASPRKVIVDFVPGAATPGAGAGVHAENVLSSMVYVEAGA